MSQAEIQYEGKCFLLKGYFKYGTHEDVAERIESLGGRIEPDACYVDLSGEVHMYKADYMVIGSKSRGGNTAWNPLEARKQYEELFETYENPPDVILEHEVGALSGTVSLTPEKLEAKRIASKLVDARHASINSIRELAYEIVEDGVITLNEALEIKRAFNREPELKKDDLLRPVWLQVYKLTKISSLDNEAQSNLIDSLHRIIDPTWHTDGEIFDEIQDKTFCLTGDFEYGSRRKVKEKLISLGGEEKSGVSQALDYLIVGSKGSDEYAYGNYGSKVKKAMEFQDRGLPIKIVPEREFGPLRK